MRSSGLGSVGPADTCRHIAKSLHTDNTRSPGLGLMETEMRKPPGVDSVIVTASSEPFLSQVMSDAERRD